MKKVACWLVLPGVLLGGLVLGAFVHAQVGGPARTVEDNAGFFSDQAKKQANAEIADIKRHFKKDLLIQTFNVPRSGFEKVDTKDKKALSQFFNNWAQDQARNSGITGVYVLVFKDRDDSKHWWIQPMVGPKTLKSGMFTGANRDELGKRFQAKFAKEPDAALLESVAYCHEALRTNAALQAKPAGGPVRPAPAPVPGPAKEEGMPPWVGYVCLGVGALLVFWFIFAIIRAMSGGGAGAGAGMGAPAGGGGFMSSLFGGLLGAAAGMWLYNNLFGHHTPTAGADPGTTPPAGGQDYSDAGQDFEGGGGGGGDWGDTGGDAGGGGGGDFGGGGGGDWGGGGGDFGGGGGGGDW